MQGLKVLATIVDEIARVNETADGRTEYNQSIAPLKYLKVKPILCSI